MPDLDSASLNTRTVWGDRGGATSFAGTRITSAFMQDVTDQLVGNPVYNVRAYGAKGDGTTDDTTAIEAWWAAALAAANASDSDPVWRLNQSRLFLPPGNYVYNGSGLSINTSSQLKEFIIDGSGPESTRITLGSSSYFIKPGASTDLSKFSISNLQTRGGKGLFRSDYTGANARTQWIFRRLHIREYSECGIGYLASDQPHVTIDHCVFDGTFVSSSYSSIGVLLSGLSDQCKIMHCDFRRNRYHVKLASSGDNALIFCNNFLRYEGSGRTSATVDIWVVPSTGLVHMGQGLVILANKFGNENLNANDYRILYADEDALTGSDAFARSHSASTSTGHIDGHIYSANKFGMADTALPCIYSTVDDVRGLIWEASNQLSAGTPSYLIQFLNAGGGDRLSASSTFYLSATSLQNAETQGAAVTNRPGFCQVIDPAGLMFHDPNVVTPPVSDEPDPAYVPLWESPVSGATLSSVTRTAITDSLGGGNADRYTGSAGDSVFSYSLATHTQYAPTVIEFDARRAAAGTPVTTIQVDLAADGLGHFVFTRFLTLTTDWRRYRWTGIAPRTTTHLNLRFRVGVGDIDVGRVRVYHARQATRTLIGVATYDPPSLADAARASTTVTVSGAQLGDEAEASFSLSTQGIILSADVTATNTVTVTFHNETGGTIDLASGTLRALVRRVV